MPSASAAPHKLPYSTQAVELTAKDKDMLGRVEAYLSDIHSISAEFLQSSPSGEVTSGKFYLQRPGKLRMEYNPPTPVLMVTSGSDIVYYDRELDQISRISLDSTLVGFLAQDQVKFDSSVTITHIEYGADAVRISLIQAKKPKDGMLTLEFSDHPLVFRNMKVTDSTGQVTAVALNNARFNMPLPTDLLFSMIRIWAAAASGISELSYLNRIQGSIPRSLGAKAVIPNSLRDLSGKLLGCRMDAETSSA